MSHPRKNFHTPHLLSNLVNTYSHIVKFLTCNNLANINARNVILLSLDFSYWNESNDIKFIKIQLVNYLKTEVYKIRKFEKIFLK